MLALACALAESLEFGTDLVLFDEKVCLSLWDDPTAGATRVSCFRVGSVVEEFSVPVTGAFFKSPSRCKAAAAKRLPPGEAAPLVFEDIDIVLLDAVPVVPGVNDGVSLR